MKHLLMFALTATALMTASTASAAIVCEKISCQSDSISSSTHDYCSAFSSFSFNKDKKSEVLITLVDNEGGKNQYFGDYASKDAQQLAGKSEDLLAKFEVDAATGTGSFVMYRRNTMLILADFELRCSGSL